MSFPKYIALCLKAIDIDTDLAEAHNALGIDKATYKYDWSGAKRSLKQAIELNPGISIVNYNYAICLAAVGRMGEAIQLFLDIYTARLGNIEEAKKILDDFLKRATQINF